MDTGILAAVRAASGHAEAGQAPLPDERDDDYLSVIEEAYGPAPKAPTPRAASHGTPNPASVPPSLCLVPPKRG